MWQGAKRDLLTVPETFARHVKVGFNCQLTGSAEVGPWCHCRSEDESSVTGQCLRTHISRRSENSNLSDMEMFSGFTLYPRHGHCYRLLESETKRREFLNLRGGLLEKLRVPPVNEIADIKTLQNVVLGLEELAGPSPTHGA